MNKKTFYDSMLDVMATELVESLKDPRLKKHQETCPTCERRLVNIYFIKGAWKCKKCWDKTLDMAEILVKEDPNERSTNEEGD